MKLATLDTGSRDGQLLLVDRTNRHAVIPDGPATLQASLDDWARHGPALAALSDQLNAGRLDAAFDLDVTRLLAPLPRAYQWLDASGYIHHVELVRKARGADFPPRLYEDPIMYQGGSDDFLAPTADIPVGDPANWGADFEAEIVVVTGDCPLEPDRAQAADSILLVGLVNDVSLRGLIPEELAKGFGFIHGKPSTAFAPFLVTPDELGAAWDGAKLSLPVVVHLNDTLVGNPNAGVDLTFDFPTLIAHGAKTRRLRAGTIVGSGTVSNRDPASGVCCLAERRMEEQIATGTMTTPFLAYGDIVRIEVHDDMGRSVFGRIEQRVAPLPA